MSSNKDIEIPRLEINFGSYHPINQTKEKLVNLLNSLGFEMLDGPEIETEKFNFDMLNIKRVIQQDRCMTHSILKRSL